MKALACGIFIIALAVSACDSAGRRCRFGSDHAVFRSGGGRFDDIALINTAGGPLAVFSDASGVYVRALDAYGLPRSRPERLTDRCDAGLAAAISSGKLWIACARRPRGRQRGAVSLYVRGAGLQERQRFVLSGEGSHGVALAFYEGRARMLWQDAAMGGARVFYADAGAQRARMLSDPDWFAGTPGLVVAGSQLQAVWDESQQRGQAFDSRVRLLDLSSAARSVTARTITEAHDGSPSPAIAADAAGSWLAFRDRRKGHRKAGLYLARVDSHGRAHEQTRVGRADGVGRPTLTACLSGLVAATPRTFAGDYFVGVIRLDHHTRAASREQQFYEDSREFSQVAAACLGSRLLLLIAERGRLGGGRAALRSAGFSCE